MGDDKKIFVTKEERNEVLSLLQVVRNLVSKAASTGLDANEYEILLASAKHINAKIQQIYNNRNNH